MSEVVPLDKVPDFLPENIDSSKFRGFVKWNPPPGITMEDNMKILDVLNKMLLGKAPEPPVKLEEFVKVSFARVLGMNNNVSSRRAIRIQKGKILSKSNF